MGQTLALLHSVEGFVFVAAAPVRSHHPLVIPGDHFLNLLVPVPGPHLVDRGLVSVEGHQVSILSTHLPASIIGVDRRSIPDPGPQLLVLLAYLASGPAQAILGNSSLGQDQSGEGVQDQGHLTYRDPHLVVQNMGGGHGPRPQPVSGSAVLVRGQVGMFPTDFAATPSAATDPHPVLSYSRSRPGGQLGNVGQLYPFLSQLLATPWAILQGHGYVHWRFGDFLRAWGLAEGEGALPGWRPGRLGLL